MMTTKGNLTTLLLTLSLFGGMGTPRQLAAIPQDGANPPVPPNTQVEYITDPSFNNMQAIAVTIPEKWHFRGVLLLAGKTPAQPYPVFRATSPDGLSMVERLPKLCWNWGWGPRMRDTNPACVHLQEAMSGQEFLKKLATLMNADYVEEFPIPEEVNAAAQKNAQSQDRDWKFFTVQNTAEVAAAIVRSKNGTFTMKGLLSVNINCHQTNYPGRRPQPYMPGIPPSEVHGCTSDVRYLVAPEDQYDALRAVWNRPGMAGRILPQWDYAMGMRIQQYGQQQVQMMQAQGQIRQQQFDHDQAVQLQMHNQFLQTMQHGTDLSMAREQAGMQARSTATSDWVDYSLNQQTVVNPGTGQLSKVSSAYSYTWVDSSGQHSFQTNDPNADPNATMTGNWTKQVVTHGDGSQ